MKPPRFLRDAVRLIATIGGYLGRNNDPPPGHQLIWQGYAMFQLMCLGLALRDEQLCPASITGHGQGQEDLTHAFIRPRSGRFLTPRLVEAHNGNPQRRCGVSHDAVGRGQCLSLDLFGNGKMKSIQGPEGDRREHRQKVQSRVRNPIE